MPKETPTPNPPSDLLDKEFLRKYVKELSAILSTEWLEQIEQSMEEIVILTPPSTIQCKIQGKWVDVLYNPMVGSNLMSASFASDFLDENPHVLTTKSLRISRGTSLKGLGILHDISLHMKDADLSLDFHVFEIPDFDIMIGHPLEKLFVGIHLSGKMDLKLGRNTVTIPITQTKNSVIEPLPPLMEVMSVAPFESPESSLEKDTQLFIEEEDDLGETIELPKEEVLTRPPIELKPLPSGLRYVFLNGNTQTSVIISDKLSEEETSHLIAILQKHRLVFGYSL
jgi:hypothetical protein